MPVLTWSSKTLTAPQPANLLLDSVVYPAGTGYPLSTAQDRLVWGDNLAVLAAIQPELDGKIDLIYTDPPFFTNRRFPARIGRGEDSRKPQDWQLAEGYPDAWKDIDAYLDMLYPRLVGMHQLLAPHGVLVLHLDWHANAYARLLLDEIFGTDRFLNEIIWVYHGPSPIRSAFNRKHDTLLVYTRSEQYTFNVDAVRIPYDQKTVDTFASSSKAGFGKQPNLERGKVPEDWWYFPVVARLHNERTGYPTQKPQALLERIVNAFSNPGELVADFFCGSGTTAVAATRLGRHYLCVDSSWRAVHTTRSRLVEIGTTPLALYHASPGAQAEAAAKRVQLSVAALPTCWRFSLSAEDSHHLDYWEIDPHWDGSTFHSAFQVTRHRKQSAVACQVELPRACCGQQVCIRYVEVSGKCGQVVLDIQAVANTA